MREQQQQRPTSQRAAYLSAFFPYFCMLSAQYFRVKVAVFLAGHRFRVCLATNLDPLPASEKDMFGNEGFIEREQIQRREHSAAAWHFLFSAFPQISPASSEWVCHMSPYLTLRSIGKNNNKIISL
jgi:hypothetical protein